MPGLCRPWVLAWLLTASSASLGAVWSGALAAPSNDQQAPDGRLTGRVADADTGSPIRGASITLTAPDGSKWIAASDDEGRFAVEQLPRVRLTWRIAKAGYVESSPPAIELDRQSLVDRGLVTISRGGVITGRVTDPYGEPVAGAAVGAARLLYRTPANRSLMNAETARTDDLGQFRLYGLASGSYFLHAGIGGMQIAYDAVAGEPSVTYATSSAALINTFFPGTPLAAEAQTIHVSAGGQTFVDIRLIAQPLATISGDVLDSRGRPASGFMTMLLPDSETAALLFRGNAAMVNAEGRFTVTNVPPGDYRLEVMSQAELEALGRGGARTAATYERASMPIHVAGDINRMVLQTSVGFSVRGVVNLDGRPIPAELAARLSVRGVPSAGVASESSVAPDGTFVLSGMVGRRAVRLSGLPPDTFTESILVLGRDVLSEGLTADGDLNGLAINLTARPTVLAGHVLDGDGQVRSGAVIVFAEDPSLRMARDGRYVKGVRSDARDGFRIAGLPPGRYLAVAVEELDSWEWANPENLKAFQSAGTPIALVKGETATVRLEVQVR
jgi:hypothetical protein